MLGATSGTQVARAISALPGCYTPELAACVDCDTGDAACYARSGYPGCDTLQLAYEADHDRTQTEVAALPYCPRYPVLPLVGAALFGVLAGSLITAALR
jgi:hypothetical protein